MARSRLAVVIPCHNEAATLGTVVGGAAKHGDVFVIDDRSTDTSRAVAETAGGRVIVSAASGYDGALTTGLRHALDAGYQAVVTLDADGEHDPALVEAFGAALAGGAGLVCGVRVRPQRSAEFVAAGLGKALFGIDDLLCGMKGYGRPALQAHFDDGGPLRLNMAPAVVWRRGGGDMVQIQVTGEVRQDAPRFGRALRANWTILKTFAALLAGAGGKARP